MANCSSKRSLLLTFLVAATLFSSGIGAEECKEDLNKLIEFCKSYVVIPGPAVPPSAQCCGVVKNVNIPCLCKYVTKSVQKTISMKKVVYVSQQCGRPLKHGSKCGDYTVPLA